MARECLRVNPGELRGYLVYLASYGLVSPETLLEMAYSIGRGI